ncbi:MAG TPA: hypothetical protein VF457_05765, partial [Burkholderiaceae bacterium]
LGLAATSARAGAGGMQPLPDEALSEVRGADGIAFNLSKFSLTSIPTNPLSIVYTSPNGSSLTLSGLDLSRTDDADTFADPYSLGIVQRSGLPDVIALDFPLNAAGGQRWSLTADFSNCDGVTAGTCTGTDFVGGTLQVAGLTMRGGGLYIAPSAVATTQGIAFGLGTQLDIDSLAIYSHGRTANDVPDTSDSMILSGIHLADAATGGAWMLADVTKHPGLINAETDATGSYLHLQVGWPTTADPVPAASFRIDNVTFTTPGAGGTPVTTNLGAASIASMQLNYVDIKFRTN